MKLGNPPNYYVQVFPDDWGEPPETAALYEGCFTVAGAGNLIRAGRGRLITA